MIPVKKAHSAVFKAAIFDLDGTLLDSMGVWERIDELFLGRRGITVPPDYARTIASLSFSETARYTIERFGLRETESELMDEWSRMAADEYAFRVPLKPYAGEYLRTLKEHGIKLSTATSLAHHLSEPVLKRNGIFHLFDATCSTDELEAGRREKSYPDVFLLAAKKLAVRPEDCVVFEDILPAIRGARSAGMRVYCVADEASREHREEIVRLADGYLSGFSEAPLPALP